MAKKITLTLTEREIEALGAALYIATASYDGWTADEMGSDAVQDMKAWTRIDNKINEA